MSHQDQFETERHRVERVLEILDRVAVRLEARGHVPLSLLSDAVEFVRASEEAAYESSQSSEGGEPALSACVEQHIAARAPVQGMQEALRALEAGDAAAAERFARFARAYVALRRDHLRLDDRLFSRAAHSTDDRTGAVPEQSAESPATRRIYRRLVEASAALPGADESTDRTEPSRTKHDAVSRH